MGVPRPGIGVPDLIIHAAKIGIVLNDRVVPVGDPDILVGADVRKDGSDPFVRASQHILHYLLFFSIDTAVGFQVDRMHDMGRRLGHHQRPPVRRRISASGVGESARRGRITVAIVDLLQRPFGAVLHQVMALDIGYILLRAIAHGDADNYGVVVVGRRAENGIVFANAEAPCVVVELAYGLQVGAVARKSEDSLPRMRASSLGAWPGVYRPE